MRPLFLATLSLLLVVLPAFSLELAETASADITGNGPNDYSIIEDFIVPNKPNSMLLVVVAGESINCQGVTFDGVALEPIPAARAQSGEQSVTFWFLLNPTAATGNIAAAVEGYSAIAAQAFLLTGVAQEEPVITATAEEPTMHGRVTLRDVPTNAFVVSAVATQSDSAALTSVSGAADIMDYSYDGAATNDVGTAHLITDRPGEFSFTWSRENDDDMAIAAVAVTGADAGE